MKRSIPWFLGFAASVMAFFVLLPDSQRTRTYVTGFWRDENPEVAALADSAQALSNRLNGLVTLRKRVLAAQLAARPAVRQARGPVIVLPGVPDSTASAFSRWVTRALEAIPGGPVVPVRAVLATDSTADAGYGKVVVLPRQAGDPCVVVLFFNTKRGVPARRHRTDDSALGACGFYARFGVPGEGMARWLRETRGTFALSDSADWAIRGRRYPMEGRFTVLYPQQTACLSGQIVECEPLWSAASWDVPRARGDSLLRAEVAHVYTAPQFAAAFAPGNSLGLLRARLGDTRFGELWRHPGGPHAAYAELEGTSLGVVIHESLLRDMEPYRPGPIPAGIPLVLGIGIAAASASLAISRTRRRRSD